VLTIPGPPLSHLEHADDIMLLTTSPEALQVHLNNLHAWCTSHRLVMNKIKTEVMIFNGYPQPMPQFFLDGRTLKITEEYCYIGVWLHAGKAEIFQEHYEEKLKAANASARALAGMDALCGRGNMAPAIGKLLYTALMDCHLTHSSEIIIENSDVVQWGVASFAHFQKRMARHVLQLRQRSFVDPLYTELGIWPIRERRLLIALSST
jgi:hypothetical protein